MRSWVRARRACLRRSYDTGRTRSNPFLGRSHGTFTGLYNGRDGPGTPAGGRTVSFVVPLVSSRDWTGGHLRDGSGGGGFAPAIRVGFNCNGRPAGATR